MKRKVVIMVSVLALVTANTPACFAYTDPAAITVDTLLVRPICLAGTILGTAIFIISLPVAITSKSVHRAAQTLVVKPAAATFKRPLGELDDLTDW